MIALVQESTLPVFSGWENFYVIVGSSAGALTGLMFVVISLVADRRTPDGHGNNDISTFGTPTVVHFTFILAVSAILSAPWRTLATPGFVLGVVAFAALGYITIITLKAMRSTGYQPVLEDWVFHIILPILCYGAVMFSAVELPRSPVHAMFTIAGSMAILLMVGIHNSWDTVTYVTFTFPKK